MASAVDETMDVGQSENNDVDDVINKAGGAGARGGRRDQRVQQQQSPDSHNSNAEIEYNYWRSRQRTSYKHLGSSSLTPAQIMEQETYY